MLTKLKTYLLERKERQQQDLIHEAIAETTRQAHYRALPWYRRALSSVTYVAIGLMCIALYGVFFIIVGMAMGAAFSRVWS